MSKLLRYCINFGGDVDTVASIALAVASNSREVEQDLPQHLTDTLENGTYGREYIEVLDRRLMAMVKR
jgi:ADP-ribosylglycohydrolase